MDESHGALSSKVLAEKYNWLTPRDSLPHLIEYSENKPGFIIMVVILCKNVERITWKTYIDEIDNTLIQDRNYYSVFKKYWEELRDTISIDNTLAIINEDGIEIVPPKI